MIPTPSVLGVSISRSLKNAALVLFAGAALSWAPSAMAGQAEADAIKNALGAKTFSNATGDEIAAAVKTVVTGAGGFNAGVVFGEALKFALALDAGEKLAALIQTDPAGAFSAIISTKVSFLSTVGATAGKGTTKDKTVYAGELPDFVNGLVGGAVNLLQGDAETAAAGAKQTPAIGAILAGFARTAPALATDGAKIAYVNGALVDSRFKKAIIDIPRYFAAEVADSAAFALAVAAPNFKNVIKIAQGATAGDPTNAGAIADKLFEAPSAGDLQTTIRKNAAKYAQIVAPGADTEEIQKIGDVLGNQIAKGATVVKLGTASKIAKGLVAAILGKPSVERANNVAGGVQNSGPAVPISVNSNDNKIDEIAETVSALVASLGTSPELIADPTGAKGAKALLKVITDSLKAKAVKNKVGGVVTPMIADQFAADLVVSVANTIEQATNAQIPDVVQGAFRTLLADSIAKLSKSTTVQTDITNNLVFVYDGLTTTEDNKFENGFNLGIDIGGQVADPETDFRPFYAGGSNQS